MPYNAVVMLLLLVSVNTTVQMLLRSLRPSNRYFLELIFNLISIIFALKYDDQIRSLSCMTGIQIHYDNIIFQAVSKAVSKVLLLYSFLQITNYLLSQLMEGHLTASYFYHHNPATKACPIKISKLLLE